MNALLLAALAVTAAPPPDGLELLGKWESDKLWSGDGLSLSADKRYAHLTTYTEHLIFDVSGAGAPVRVGSYPVSQGRSHHLDGETLYIATGRRWSSEPGRVHVVDVAVPSLPTRLAEISSGGLVAGMATHAGHLYMAVSPSRFTSYASELRVYSLSAGRAAPSLARKVVLYDDEAYVDINSLAIVSGHAYVGVTPDELAGEKLVIFDVRSPAIPTRLPDSLRGFPTDTHGFHGIHRMVQAGARVYAAYADAGVAVLDVSNPAAPAVLGTWHGDHLYTVARTFYRPHVPAIAVEGDVVYITVRNAIGEWVHALDASIPAAMREVLRHGGRRRGLLGNLAAGGSGRGGRLYMVGRGSLSAYLPTPSKPVLLPALVARTPSTPVGCYRYDGRVHVLNRWMYSGEGNTVGGCVARCAERKYKFAGVEAGRHCWCGRKGPREGAARTVSAECDVPCTGDAKAACGGALHRVSVYSLEDGPHGGEKEEEPAEVGCFRTKKGSALELSYTSEKGNTVGECTAVCRSNGFKYAGVMAGSQCLCGDALPKGRAPDSKCRLPCSANKQEVCGGNTRVSVYAVDGSLWRRAPEYEEEGCYETEHVGMELAYTDKRTQTVEGCVAACAYGGHTRAGLQFGKKCWCGGDSAVSKADAGNHAECTQPCAGNAKQSCGGSNAKLSVYSIRN